MKRIGLVLSLMVVFSMCLSAQNVSVVKKQEGLILEGIYNNGTTVKKYTFDPLAPKPTKPALIQASDTLFAMKGEQIPSKSLLDALSNFLGGVPVLFLGDSTEIYDLDLEIKLENPSLEARKTLLEELGFEFKKADVTVLVADKK